MLVEAEGVPPPHTPSSRKASLSELTSVARDLQAAIGASVDSNFTSPGPDELADITDVSAERVEALRPPEDVDECTSD